MTGHAEHVVNLTIAEAEQCRDSLQVVLLFWGDDAVCRGDGGERLKIVLVKFNNIRSTQSESRSDRDQRVSLRRGDVAIEQCAVEHLEVCVGVRSMGSW